MIFDDEEFMESHDIPEPSPKEYPKWLINADIVKDSKEPGVWVKGLFDAVGEPGRPLEGIQYLIGRMYRNHLAEDDVSICLVAFENDHLIP